jgi:hypothetical protein
LKPLVERTPSQGRSTERLLGRILFIFAAGFVVLGLVVGLIRTNNGDVRGAVLNHDGGCDQPSGLVAMVVVLWGLALICTAAGIAAMSVAPPRPHWTDPPSTSVRVPRPGELDE